jgi:hypothetical protein
MSRIKNTYGDCLDFDFVLAESIWQDDNDWMMGLLKQERILKAYWNEEHNSKMKNNLVDIILYAVADSADEGYIAIEYIFSNFEQHKVEQQQQEDEAL